MNKEIFDKYYRNILQKAAKKRTEKETEYFSTFDVMSNFRKIAKFRDNPLPVVLMDLGAKPIQSISDMVNDQFKRGHLADESITLAEWDEKFVDSLNYLLKLYASIREIINE